MKTAVRSGGTCGSSARREQCRRKLADATLADDDILEVAAKDGSLDL